MYPSWWQGKVLVCFWECNRKHLTSDHLLHFTIKSINSHSLVIKIYKIMISFVFTPKPRVDVTPTTCNIIPSTCSFMSRLCIYKHWWCSFSWGQPCMNSFVVEYFASRWLSSYKINRELIYSCTFLHLGFVFMCVVSVSCTKGQPLSMKGQQLCQQDMGLIMKNSKANVQVSNGSVMFSLSIYDSLSWNSDLYWLCLFGFSFSSTHLVVFLFMKQTDTKILWPGLNALICDCFIWFYYSLCFPDWFSHQFDAW